MTGLEISIIAFILMLVAIFMRLPIGVAMAIAGFAGTWVMLGSPYSTLNQLKSLTFDTFSKDSLSIVPMFLLMGHFATKSGISKDLFRAAADWVGHRKGGMAIASIGACAGFGAVCGSSIATASTMGQVALPEMRRYGYSDSLSTGVLAAGGTLGILIPPSIILVIYAIITEQNIMKMFVAAAIPALLAILGYIISIMVYVRIKPNSAKTAPRVEYKERIRNLINIWPVVLIFLLVIGGIYGGVFTPTEGAAVGVVGTAAYGFISGGLDFDGFLESLLATATTTAMIFFIILGAQLFNSFLALTQTPQALVDWVNAENFSPIILLLCMLVCYLILGCVMDSLSMILLTLPIFFPIIQTLDFGIGTEGTEIWFGIITLIVVEVGLITPPVGMNLFIVNAIDNKVPITQTYLGVTPFIISDIIRVGILIAFPSLTLWLVNISF